MKTLKIILIFLVFLLGLTVGLFFSGDIIRQCWIYNQAEEENNQALFEELNKCLNEKL